MNCAKYKRAYFKVPIENRTWPAKEIEKAPVWCSVDLRDGNQALFSPMTLAEKLEFFSFLVKMGFKEIEVGFPAASDTEFMFVRKLIEDNLIPDDVAIQVLTQSREHIIKRTIDSVKGAKNAIIHLYNSTSSLQREVVFSMNEQQVIDLAVSGAKTVVAQSSEMEGNIRYEYSPESFTCTEMEFAVKVCNEVLDVFAPTPQNKVVINLPSSIEVATPNVFADQIQYMSDHLKYRENVILSVHAHNDRGTAVAASELAMLAGAQRVEGTIFGNGERTGNADIVVIALNMLSQGIDPGLKLDNIDEIIEAYEKFNRLTIHPRHPYAGEMAYIAFSGSHQDAIKKSIDLYAKSEKTCWRNPYLTIDPSDLGRAYEPILINSQSGKGGIGYVMENKFGYSVPKKMLVEFSKLIKKISDQKATVLSQEAILDAFKTEYVNIETPVKLMKYNVLISDEITTIDAVISNKSKITEFSAEGNGPLDAFCKGMGKALGIHFEIVDYKEHALEKSSTAKAASYIEISNGGGKLYWGAGIDSNINTSSIKALISAVNKTM